MSVVPAGMHHACVFARVRKAGRLLDGQRVEISADRQSFGSVAAPKRCYNAGLANSGCDLVAPLGKQPGDDAGGAGLFERESRAPMQVTPDFDELVDPRGNIRVDALEQGRRGLDSHASANPKPDLFGARPRASPRSGSPGG